MSTEFSPAAIEQLKQLVRREMSTVRVPPFLHRGTPRSGRPLAWIAKTTGEITEATTGDGDDIAGSGTVNLFHLTTGSAVSLIANTTGQVVYNHRLTSIPAGAWVRIWQDGYGRYWADEANDTTWIVRFEVTDADAGLRVVDALIHTVPPGRTVEEAPEYNTVVPAGIEICDPMGCLFNEPVGELLGRQGFAIWTKPLGTSICQASTYDVAAHWEVFMTCCPGPGCD